MAKQFCNTNAPKSMHHDSSSMRRPATRRAIFRFLVAVVILIVLAIAALFWPRKPSPASLALDAKLAQLRSNGVPLTALEIAKVLPDPDPAHDARILLRDAFATLDGDPAFDIPFVGAAALPPRSVGFAESTMQSMEQYLSHSDAMLAKIPDGLDGVWFSRGWTNGYTNLLKISFIDLRKVTQTLAVKAVFEADNGNLPKTSEALRKGFAIANSINGDDLVSAMIRVACAGLMCDAAERSLNRIAFSDNDLQELNRRIDVERIYYLDHTFIAERHMGMLVLDAARRGRDYFENSTIKRLFRKFERLFSRDRKKFYRDEDYLLFLNTMDEWRSAHALPGVERIRRYEQLAAFYDANIRSETAELVMPSWQKAMRIAAERKARLLALKTALAIERYRLAHNTLPASLDVLVPQYLPAAPRDPMDEQPLRFKKLPRGYVVYSVGADGIDNSGIERGSLTNNFDLTVTIER